MTKIKDICQFLESFANPYLQESYDNSGLLIGDENLPITSILVSLDCTEEVVQEAIDNNCNLIVAHHPLIFSGVKKITGKNYVERTIIKAIKHDIAIFAIHTNLDNIQNGVSFKIAEKLGLQNVQILDKKSGNLVKLITYAPHSHANHIKEALFKAGAGKVGNYEECSFSSEGIGSFKASEQSKPFVGEKGITHFEPETRIELIFPIYIKNQVIKALKDNHPYEEVAYQVIKLENENQETGSGVIGNLPVEMDENEFLAHLKEKMELKLIRYTKLSEQKINKVAICGGAGSFLTKKAISSGSQAFITADFKYHEFFDAENRLLIADIGHFESEKYTKDLLRDLIVKKFPNFAVLLSFTNTNPVNYYI
ncbi:MAG: Nif3-like dinuclear metal center hexameric protein [Bacteroidia bacterium]